MESVNILVDDFKFSKEDVISSLNEEVDEEATADQTDATTSNAKIRSSESIATADKSEIESIKPCCNVE